MQATTPKESFHPSFAHFHHPRYTPTRSTIFGKLPHFSAHISILQPQYLESSVRFATFAATSSDYWALGANSWGASAVHRNSAVHTFIKHTKTKRQNRNLTKHPNSILHSLRHSPTFTRQEPDFYCHSDLTFARHFSYSPIHLDPWHLCLLHFHVCSTHFHETFLAHIQDKWREHGFHGPVTGIKSRKIEFYTRRDDDRQRRHRPRTILVSECGTCVVWKKRHHAVPMVGTNSHCSRVWTIPR